MLHLHNPTRPRPDPMECFRLAGGRTARIRPLRADDAVLYPAFDAGLTDEDRRSRFFSAAPMSSRQIERLTQFDRALALADIAVDRQDGQMLGVSRLHRFAPGRGEFAVVVRSDVKGQDLGRLLLERIIDAAGEIDVDCVEGLILPDNVGMLALTRELGFSLGPDHDDPTLVRARLDLRFAGVPAQRPVPATSRP